MTHERRQTGKGWARCVVAMLTAMGASSAQAQSVAMTGSMGSKALLVINGGPPKAMAAGDTVGGVKVLSVKSDQTVVEVGGKREVVALGGAPVSVGGGGPGEAAGTRIVLSAGSGGHFVTQGNINGRATSFMVDTGATTVAMGMDEARRLGIAYEKGDRYWGSTANGNVMGYRVTLGAVQIQDVVVHNVEAAVLPGSMPFILLGNSFLTRFQMTRNNDVMTLTRRF